MGESAYIFATASRSMPFNVNVALQRWSTDFYKLPSQSWLNARSRGGKTNVIMNLLASREVREKHPYIVVFCPSQAVTEYYIPAGIPAKFIHSEIDVEKLNVMFDKQQKHVSTCGGSQNAHHLLLVFDDCAAQPKALMSDPFRKMVFNGMQSNISFIFATQFVTIIPCAYRGMGTYSFAWKPETDNVAKHMRNCWFTEFNNHNDLVHFFSKSIGNAATPRYALLVKNMVEDHHNRLANVYLFEPPVVPPSSVHALSVRQKAAAFLLDKNARILDDIAARTRERKRPPPSDVDEEPITQAMRKRGAVLNVIVEQK